MRAVGREYCEELALTLEELDRYEQRATQRGKRVKGLLNDVVVSSCPSLSSVLSKF